MAYLQGGPSEGRVLVWMPHGGSRYDFTGVLSVGVSCDAEPLDATSYGRWEDQRLEFRAGEMTAEVRVRHARVNVSGSAGTLAGQMAAAVLGGDMVAARQLADLLVNDFQEAGR